MKTLKRSLIVLNRNKIQSLLGLATKAGKTVSGEFAVEKSVKAHQAYLVIIAADASENTKKKFENMCAFYKVPVYFSMEKEALGRAIGKEYRASVGVTDMNFAAAIKKQYDES